MVSPFDDDSSELPGFTEYSDSSKLKVSVRNIGPAEAQELINGSDFNRKVTKATVKKYADQMVNKRWWENGQPIIINGKKLLNGAHRCHAIVISGVTLPFVVVEGVDPKANRTMDIGKPRTLDQMLELEGKQAPKQLAEALTWLIGYVKGARLGDSRKFTVLDKFDLLFEHKGLQACANKYTLRVPGKSLLNQGLYACVHYLFAQKSPEDAEVFMNQVIGGENLQKGDPAYSYREGVGNLIADDDLKKTEALKARCANSLIYAWNKFRSKEQWPKFKLIDATPDIL
jgi:hypothetical protein